jgi:hypothetical protein
MYKTSTLTPTANTARNFHIAKAGLETRKWVQAHPGSTALAAGTVLTFLFPGVIVTPLLAGLGFGSAGVASR